MFEAQDSIKDEYIRTHPEEQMDEYPCQICLMPLFEDEAQLVHKISTCSHVYHRECLT